MGMFIGTVYCEEISLPDEGNKGKDCGRKGKRDLSPSSGMYHEFQLYQWPYNQIFFISVATYEAGTGRRQLKTQHAG